MHRWGLTQTNQENGSILHLFRQRMSMFRCLKYCLTASNRCVILWYLGVNRKKALSELNIKEFLRRRRSLSILFCFLFLFLRRYSMENNLIVRLVIILVSNYRFTELDAVAWPHRWAWILIHRALVHSSPGKFVKARHVCLYSRLDMTNPLLGQRNSHFRPNPPHLPITHTHSLKNYKGFYTVGKASCHWSRAIRLLFGGSSVRMPPRMTSLSVLLHLKRPNNKTSNSCHLQLSLDITKWSSLILTRADSSSQCHISIDDESNI